MEIIVVNNHLCCVILQGQSMKQGKKGTNMNSEYFIFSENKQVLGGRLKSKEKHF